MEVPFKKRKTKRKCKKSCQVSRIACDQLYHEWSDVHAIHGKLNERKQFCLRRLLKSRYISFPIRGQYRLFAIENSGWSIFTSVRQPLDKPANEVNKVSRVLRLGDILLFSSQRQIPLTRVLYVGSGWGGKRRRVLRRFKGGVCVGSLFGEKLLPAASQNQRVLDVKLPTVSFFAQPFTCCRHVTTQLQKKENGWEGDYGLIIEPFQMTSCPPYCLPCMMLSLSSIVYV